MKNLTIQDKNKRKKEFCVTISYPLDINTEKWSRNRNKKSNHSSNINQGKP